MEVGVHEMNGGSVEFDCRVVPAIEAILCPFVFFTLLNKCDKLSSRSLLYLISREGTDYQEDLND